MIARDFYTSIYLDGTASSGVRVPHDSRLALTGNVTLCAWIKPLSGSGGFGIIAKRSGNNAAFILSVSSGRSLAFYKGDGAALDLIFTPNGAVPRGAWTHVAATKSAAGQVNLYINGVKAPYNSGTGAIAGGAAVDSGTDVVIGNETGATTVGNIDEPAIYDRVLTQQEIWGIYDAGNYPQKPTLLFRFDEGGSSTALDTESGNAWVGTRQTGASYHPDVPADMPVVDQPYSTCYGPDGSIRYILSDDLGRQIDGCRAMSIAAWLKWPSAGSGFAASQIPFTLGSANNVISILCTDSGQIAVGGRSDDNVDLFQSCGISQTVLGHGTAWTGAKWMHVAGEIDFQRKSVALYVNGIHRRTIDTGLTMNRNDLLTTATTRIVVGAGSLGSANRSTIHVASAAIWSRALGRAAYRDMYLSGNYQKDSSMEVWYKLQEGMGNTVAEDFSGKRRNGTLQAGGAAATYNFLAGRGPFA